MADAQGLFTSLADTMVWLAKGFNKVGLIGGWRHCQQCMHVKRKRDRA